MRHFYIIFSIAMLCMACDPYSHPQHGKVVFSADTVFFDTVFSTIGSATREFRAINKNRDPLLIDHLYLAGGNSSPFRININGKPVPEAYNIVLPAGDSIFIFVDVIIDPRNETSPVSVIDSVIFESGGKVRWVILEAWGQDIILIRDEIIGNTVWNAGKPYVIYGSLFVDTTATLTLNPGTRLFFHHNALMTVAGTVIAAGTFEKPVLFASDRITEEYEDVPGQWKGMTFNDCSKASMLAYTVIRNAVTGISITSDNSSVPELMIINSKIMHNSVGSLIAVNANVYSANSLFSHSGFNTISVSGNGSYDFIHCTIANRWEYGFRTAPVFFISKDNGILPDVTITNSVITGNLENELMINATPGEIAGKILADSSLIKVDTLTAPWWNRNIFKSVITKGEAGFIEESKYDYRPDTLSLLLNMAGRSEAVNWPFDIRNKMRPTGEGPDIGAYERQTGEKKNKE